MKKVKVTTPAEFHHLPHEQTPVELQELTLRQALKILRTMDFGNIGGMFDVILSDGTFLSVDLTPCAGGQLMNSQRVTRYKYMSCGPRIIRHYKL